MQPYFFPYIGYFQLMAAVDTFVVYDNIEYTKKGWINRNRILINGLDAFISVPIKKDSDYLQIKDRWLANSWPKDRIKMLNRITDAYRKAPQFSEVFPLIEDCLVQQENNLFRFLFQILEKIKSFLKIETSFLISSEIPINHNLKADQKVISLSQAVGADEYINPIGGLKLYDKKQFKEKGIELYFVKTGQIVYQQFDHDFTPHLSIIDVMMFNSPSAIKKMLNEYQLV